MNDKVNFLNFFIDSKFYEDLTVGGRITEYIPACVFMYNGETGQITYGNAMFREKFKHSFFQTGSSYGYLADLVHRHDIPVFESALKAFDQVEEGRSHSFGCRFNDPETGYRYYLIAGTVLRSRPGKALSILFISTDVTADTQAYKEVSSINEIYQHGENTHATGSWMFDLATGALTCTPGFYALLGYDRAAGDAGVNMSLELYLSHVAPESRMSFRQQIDASLASRAPFQAEHVIRTRQGVMKNVLTKGAVVVRGEEVRMIATTTDITRVRSIEKEQQRNIDELNRSNKELEEFAYVASHDLQEPIRKIAMYSERLLARSTHSLDQEAHFIARRIQVCAQSMKVLIDNLLEFSRAHGGVNGFAEVDLNRILDKVRNNLELKIDETSTEIMAGPLPTIEAVATEMEQLFTNLISNSIKFRQQSKSARIEITSRAGTATEKAQYRLAEDRDYYVIEVKDNGIGFEQENAERIFRIFERLHGKAEYPGTGIGLAICKRIVDNHRGIIVAQGSPDSGASFTVMIPAKQV